MTKELIAIAVFLLALFFAHRTGVSKGKRDAAIDNAEDREGLQNEIADAELEAKRNKSIVDRLNDIRSRISKRREP